MEDAFGFQIVLTKNEFRGEDFEKSWLGYRTDYLGIGIYIL